MRPCTSEIKRSAVRRRGTLNGLGGEGVFGELNVGYDQDFGNWVAGVMVDARYSGISTKLDTVSSEAAPSIDTDYGFDVLGRAGMKLKRRRHLPMCSRATAGSISKLMLPPSATPPTGARAVRRRRRLRNSRLRPRHGRPRIPVFAIRKRGFLVAVRRTSGTLESEPSFHTVSLGANYKLTEPQTLR